VELLLCNDSSAREWLSNFTQHKALPELCRRLTVNLIERIVVYNGKRIDVRFRYQDRLEAAYEITTQYFKKAGCF
jgi:hypothetical protein